MKTLTDRVNETLQRMADLDPVECREAWLHVDLWADIGPKLTCTEAEALGVLLVLAGAFDGDVAHLIVEHHGCGDDEGDLHQHEEGGYDPERDDFDDEVDTPPDYEGDRYG